MSCGWWLICPSGLWSSSDRMPAPCSSAHNHLLHHRGLILMQCRPEASSARTSLPKTDSLVILYSFIDFIWIFFGHLISFSHRVSVDPFSRPRSGANSGTHTTVSLMCHQWVWCRGPATEQLIVCPVDTLPICRCLPSSWVLGLELGSVLELVHLWSSGPQEDNNSTRHPFPPPGPCKRRKFYSFMSYLLKEEFTHRASLPIRASLSSMAFGEASKVWGSVCCYLK